MIILFWIFIVYMVMAVIITIGCLLDSDELPDSIAMGSLWLFWLSRATLRSIARMLKEG